MSPAPVPPPPVFGHRGAPAHAPENTLAAFRRALADGAPAVEFDVKLSADRQVIVLHDQRVDRTTDGRGNVAHMRLAEIRELDAGSWFGQVFKGERIPTLDEVFATFGRQLYMNVELTNYAAPFDGLVHVVAELVRRHALEDNILFSSFFPTNLALARRLLPRVARAQLALPGAGGWWQRLAGRLMPLDAEHPYRADVTAASVARAHARGRRVNVWTVNDPAEMRALRAIGVDGIISDDPGLALQVLREAV